ncbi:hypothetical protein P8452_56743 [Trifolium repens]|nr:hypothetical protein P8452_56743 [Trifolium repens]
MKIKHFFFTFFLCALIHISVVAIKPSKDEIQFGATEEFKTKNEFDEWREWEGWNWGGRQGNGGGEKEGRHGGGAMEKVNTTEVEETTKLDILERVGN